MKLYCCTVFTVDCDKLRHILIPKETTKIVKKKKKGITKNPIEKKKIEY